MAISILGVFIFPAIAKEAGMEQPLDYPYVEAINAPNYYIGEAPKWTQCSCVEFAKWYLGRQGEVWGWAGKMKPTSKEPYVGGLVITKEGGGHVAVIKTIVGNKLHVVEGNYKPCEKTERILDRDDPNIVGFQ